MRDRGKRAREREGGRKEMDKIDCYNEGMSILRKKRKERKMVVRERRKGREGTLKKAVTALYM